MQKTSNSLFALFILLTGLFMPLQVQAESVTPYSLDELMQALADNGDSKARFTETRSSRLTRKPVESSGVLEFISPDGLVRHISQPREMLFEVRGDKVTIERNGKRQTRSLYQLGAAQAFIESLRGTLAGDQQVLEAFYKLQLNGDLQSWKLTLSPLEAELAKKISRIQIKGVILKPTIESKLQQRARVSSIEVHEKNGSITRTILEEIR